MPFTAGRFSHCFSHRFSHPLSSLCPAHRRLAISRVAALVLVVLMTVASTGVARAAGELPSQASVQEFAYKAVDVFPIRFGGVLRLIAGSALLVPATLFSTLSLPFDRNPGVYRDNYEMLVVEPFDFTFRRPLGQDLGGL